jgi:hypothetical protein
LAVAERERGRERKSEREREIERELYKGLFLQRDKECIVIAAETINYI